MAFATARILYLYFKRKIKYVSYLLKKLRFVRYYSFNENLM